MKKITFLNLHMGFGGIESSTINTANKLSKDYEVEIIAFYDLDHNQAYKLNKDVKIKYLYKGGPNRDEIKECIKKFKLVSLFKEALKAIKILKLKKSLMIKEIAESDSDVIVSTTYSFSRLLSKYGKSNTIKIAQEHQHHNDNQKYINVIKNDYNNIDYLFALTNSLKEDYELFLKDNNHTKVVLVPNMLINYPDTLSKLKSDNIVSVGRLHPGKRIDELIKIFSKIENKTNKLYIIGSGEEYDNLKQLVIDLKLEDRVLLLGNMTHEEMKPYMLDSALFAMTSVTEALPMVLLEAMSYGIPTIAYETRSGTNDIIDDGCGYIIKNRDESVYISKINEYLNLKDKKTISKKALEKAHKFSSDEIIKIWKTIIDK